MSSVSSALLSPFIEKVQRRYTLFDQGFPVALPSASQIEREVSLQVLQSTTRMELKQRLRWCRYQYLSSIAYTDLNRLVPTMAILDRLSSLADSLIVSALGWLHAEMVQCYGTPIGQESGRPQQLIILGMGKLGGRELNFSSDIDLIFVYPEAGNTQGAAVSISNEVFFTRLAQAFNQVLTELTADGFVYRVDMRLRPFGQTGPLVSSFNALEIYYQRHGRAWERYAAQKARAITGDPQDIHRLFHDIITPFVYRRYTDFSVIEAIRELKQMIRQDVQKKGREQNIKLGEGGIREAEFVVQALQQVYGGRQPKLQTQSWLQALHELTVLGLIDEDEVAVFREAYLYLRQVENHLQEWNDEQTQQLPSEPEVQQFLAKSMGHQTYDAFLIELGLHRSVVQHQFMQVVEENQDLVSSDEDEALKIVLEAFLQQDEALDQPLMIQSLQSMGASPTEAEAMVHQLLAFRQSSAVRLSSQTAMDRLVTLLPWVIKEVLEDSTPARTLGRVLSVLEVLVQRSIYLVLLEENPQTIRNLVRVCAASPWLTEQLVKTPALMDQLIEVESLTQLPNAETLKTQAMEIVQQAQHHESNRVVQLDEEFFMNQIRIWRHAQVFKVAVADIEQRLPVMAVSDHLTWIAEAALSACVTYAGEWMRQKFGQPKNEAGEAVEATAPFMVIGYGKLGGQELGYGSDLDIVMLYDGISPSTYSTGGSASGKSLENSLYFLRMGQKVISLMTTPMPTGKLYEVDTRLRPNGGSGLMVTDFASYQAYIENKAWVWEHQALVRARPVVASEENLATFTRFRQQFLQQPREAEMICQEVVNMLQKMRKALDHSDAQRLDLKYGEGGIVEIEFLVQYLVLTKAHDFPELTQWTDNIRLLESLKKVGVLSPEQAETLIDTYQMYRQCYHRQALQNEKTIVPREQFSQQAQQVHTLWQTVMPCIKE